MPAPILSSNGQMTEEQQSCKGDEQMISIWSLTQQSNRSEQFALCSLPYGRKRAAMERRRTQAVKLLKMFGRAIAFVLGKAIAGELDVVFHHHPVAGDLGYDRSRGDTEALTVAADDTCLRQFQVGDKAAIDQNMVGPSQQ